MLWIVLTVVGVLWLGLIVVALSLCAVSARADRRAETAPPPGTLSGEGLDLPRQRPSDDTAPPPTGASGAA